MSRLPKYTKEKMQGNIGEALVQYLLSNFCLVHKIDGSTDIGNDFICELIKDEYPTNLLFYVQVKYWETEPNIRLETKAYWKGSPIPVYLFWVKKESNIPQDLLELKKFYKRYTPISHGKIKESAEEFHPYEEIEFKRHLIIDYARTQYFKGFTPVIKGRAFMRLSEKRITGMRRYVLYTKDVIPEYSKELIQKGWVNLYTISTLLYKEGGAENRIMAEQILGLSKKLLLSQGTKEEKEVFLEEIEEFEEKIRKEQNEDSGNHPRVED